MCNCISRFFPIIFSVQLEVPKLQRLRRRTLPNVGPLRLEMPTLPTGLPTWKAKIRQTRDVSRGMRHTMTSNVELNQIPHVIAHSSARSKLFEIHPLHSMKILRFFWTASLQGLWVDGVELLPGKVKHTQAVLSPTVPVLCPIWLSRIYEIICI